MPSPPYNNSPGYSTSYHSAGSRASTVKSLRMSILFYSAHHLNFIKLLFHPHVLLFDHLYCWRTACRLLTYRTRALESSIHRSLCTIDKGEVCARRSTALLGQVSVTFCSLLGPPGALDSSVYRPMQLCCVRPHNLELTTHRSLIASGKWNRVPWPKFALNRAPHS